LWIVAIQPHGLNQIRNSLTLSEFQLISFNNTSTKYLETAQS